MENTSGQQIKTPPTLPPPLPETKEGHSRVKPQERRYELTDKQKSIRRIVRFTVIGLALVIIAGTVISKFTHKSDQGMKPEKVTPTADKTYSAPATSDNSRQVEQSNSDNESEKEWQGVLSPQFKFYKEADDIPGQIDRYRDDMGHRLVTEAWGRNIYSDNADTALTEALNLVFEGKSNVTRTKDSLYISTGVRDLSNQEKEYYYVVYWPKFMQSYSLYSKQSDMLFSTYSKKLLDAVRAMKASN